MHKVVLWIQRCSCRCSGAPGIFVVAFLDSSFLSIPEINDILIVTSSRAHPERAWLYVVMTTLGSVAGCLVLWELGRRGGEAFLVRRFGAARVERTRAAFQKWDVLALAIPSLLPAAHAVQDLRALRRASSAFRARRLALTLARRARHPLHLLGGHGRRLRRRGAGSGWRASTAGSPTGAGHTSRWSRPAPSLAVALVLAARKACGARARARERA